MEIKVNKEIRDYTEKIFFGLSIRQFFFSVMACLIAVVIYFILKGHFGTEIVSWACIIGAIPFAVLGFVKYNGMYAEEFIIAFIKSEILMPSYLLFVPENFYEELLKEDFKKLEMEELKNGI